MSKTVTISARVSQEDAEFISQLSIEDAKTPSDKVRALISESRHRHQQPENYGEYLSMFENMINPLHKAILETELNSQQHSELVTRIMPWLSETMAFILSQGHTHKSDIKAFEKGITERVFRLTESYLQLAASNQVDCYDPEILHTRIKSVLELFTTLNQKYPSTNN